MSPSTVIRVLTSHPRTIAGLLAGLVAWLALLPWHLGTATHLALAWDVGGLVLLGLLALVFIRETEDTAMAAKALRQQDGEWVIFIVTVLGAVISFAALTSVLGEVKTAPPDQRGLLVALVAGTLLLSWLLTHIVFAVRYAHEYYSVSPHSSQVIAGGAKVDGGLQFPGDDTPDYWDFVYFGIVLGMTFQVSDVQITSRKLRRLATVHGLIGFLFNTVIVALTVNIAASLLN